MPAGTNIKSLLLSHWNCCVSLEEISVTLVTTCRNDRVCTLLTVQSVISLEVLNMGVTLAVAV
jgi:hypothetical protein